MKAPKGGSVRDGVAFDAQGLPILSARQIETVHRYCMDIVRRGASRRKVSQFLLTCALFELALHASGLQLRLENFIMGAVKAVPARDVAKIAVALIHRLRSLPDDTAREQFLQAMLGEDDDSDSTSGQRTH